MRRKSGLKLGTDPSRPFCGNPESLRKARAAGKKPARKTGVHPSALAARKALTFRLTHIAPDGRDRLGALLTFEGAEGMPPVQVLLPFLIGPLANGCPCLALMVGKPSRWPKSTSRLIGMADPPTLTLTLGGPHIGLTLKARVRPILPQRRRGKARRAR